MANIATQPVPEHIAVARSALVSLHAAHPDVDVSLAASLALALLDNVQPPYPPPEPSVEPVNLTAGLAAARRTLARAAREAITVAESLRIGRAGAELVGVDVSRESS